MRISMTKISLLFIFSLTLAAASVNYSYDSAGRLVKIDYGAGGSITYTYDSAGNLLSRTTVSAASTPAPPATAKPGSPVKKPVTNSSKKPLSAV